MDGPPVRSSHFLLASIPVAATPLITLLLAEGIVFPGGGEKTLLFVIPYLVWAMVFLISSAILIYKRWPLLRWISASLTVSTSVIVLFGLAAFVLSSLGIG